MNQDVRATPWRRGGELHCGSDPAPHGARSHLSLSPVHKLPAPEVTVLRTVQVGVAGLGTASWGLSWREVPWAAVRYFEDSRWGFSERTSDWRHLWLHESQSRAPHHVAEVNTPPRL